MPLSRMACSRAVAGHRPARETETAQPLHRVQRRPKPQERPEGKGKEESVPPGYAGRAENLHPIVHDVVPALRGIQPADRHGRGAAGLMAAHVGFQGKRQVRPVRRVGQPVPDQVMPRGDRDRRAYKPPGWPAQGPDRRRPVFGRRKGFEGRMASSNDRSLRNWICSISSGVGKPPAGGTPGRDEFPAAPWRLAWQGERSVRLSQHS